MSNKTDYWTRELAGIRWSFYDDMCSVSSEGIKEWKDVRDIECGVRLWRPLWNILAIVLLSAIGGC